MRADSRVAIEREAERARKELLAHEAAQRFAFDFHRRAGDVKPGATREGP